MYRQKRWKNGAGTLTATINFPDTVWLPLIMCALAMMLGMSDQACWNGKLATKSREWKHWINKGCYL